MDAKPPQLEFDISGIHLRIRHLPIQISELFRVRWKRYLALEPVSPILSIDIAVEGPTISGKTLQAKGMTSEIGDTLASFAMPEGSIEVRINGRASARLRPAPAEVQYHALINLLTGALAWLLPSRDAGFLHAAGVVLDDRAFVLVGPEGGGKTSWARLAKSGGALFLSDDMIFVDAAGDEVMALSTPIRGDHPVPHGPGRWPLAALLFPKHGTHAGLAPAPRLLAAARLVANLPFLSDVKQQDRRVEALIARLLDRVPALELTFSLDASFLECLRSFSGGGR